TGNQRSGRRHHQVRSRLVPQALPVERARRHRTDDGEKRKDRGLRGEGRRRASLGINMANFNLLLLPGDGIGPEVMAQAKNVIAWLEKNGIAKFNLDEDLVGGAAYESHGKAISEGAMEKALAADAVLFGAVGGPKWDKVAYDVRPEAGLLRLRKDLALFANLRP